MSVFRVLVMLGMLAGLMACSATAPQRLMGQALPDCPSSPNCVASFSVQQAKRVQPLRLSVPVAEAQVVLKHALYAMPRTIIAEERDGYLRTEHRSLLFRFVDDLELKHNPEAGYWEVRSAARSGYADFGVNRRRVEALRQALAARGVLAP